MASDQHHRGDAVAPAREQVLAQPSRSAPVSSTGGASCRRSPTGMDVGHAQRSLSAMRLLYQFMKAEIDRLTER